MKKIFSFILRHKIISLIILVVIITGSYFGYQKINTKDNGVSYGSGGIVKGMLISSISGIGQVSALNQVDIKPKVSGDVVYLNIKNDQEVKAGTLLAQIDSRNVSKSIRDAQVALESAKTKLEDLLAQPDAKFLLQAENSLAQAERDLAKAKEDYDEIEIDTERTLATTYEDGYSSVSDTFFKLSDYMADLKDVLGTEAMSEAHISAYELILGKDSIFTKKLLEDYDDALDEYNKNFIFFRNTYSNAERDVIYELIKESLETTKSIAQALESARHMYDSSLSITSHINNMQPKIESDVSSVYSNISSLQRIIETIDDTVKDTPKKIEDAKIAIQTAKERLAEKKLELEEIKVGTDPNEIKTQEYTVLQKQEALWDAQENWSDYSVYAPFDGILTSVNSKIIKGDSVSSGTVLASMITEQKIAEITLNEIDVAQIKTGQKATLNFDAVPDLSITGEVVEVDTLGTVNQGVVSYGVKVAFDVQDERVKPGMSVSVNIIIESKSNVLLAPLSAVKTIGTNNYVEILVDGQPQRKTVTVGSSNDTQIEITSGLEEGEEIITQTINNSATASQNNPSNQGGNTGSFGGGSFRMLR
jgi:RND family efflux transporter MFP subunit